MAKISKANSLRRLTLDWEELQRDPVPACSAYPIDDDLLEWHADLGTVDGPLQGVSFHVVLLFPADYPLNAPKFKFPTGKLPSFRHPNLYGSSFCVDILDGSFGRSYSYGGQSGWTPAYTVRGLIQQLSTFIFHRADEGRGSEIHWSPGTGLVDRIRTEAQAFRCPCAACGRKEQKVWRLDARRGWVCSVAEAAVEPERTVVPVPVQPVQPLYAGELPPAAREAAGELAQQLRLPTWFLLQALELLDGPGLLVFGQVCRAWRRAAVRGQMLARRETRCYFTKHSATEAVLGVGLTAAWHDDGNVRSVKVVLDVLSAEAFDAGVRRGAYGESFADFLPLALEPQHFHSARPRIEKAIARLATRQSDASSLLARQPNLAFAPWMALTALPAAMNDFVVNLIEEGARTGRVARHASERALWGYCSLHHLLLALAETYPSLKAIAAGMVKEFVASPENRTKAECPDLGQLLVLQTLADEPWDALARPLLDEAMARNVMWVERELGNSMGNRTAGSRGSGSQDGWSTVLQGTSKKLCGLSRDGWFTRTLTSKRLLMFQAAFLRQTPPPADALATYAARFGQPTEAAQAALLTAARSILKVDSWEGFFPMFGLQTPDAPLGDFVDGLVRDSLLRSDACGYTGSRRKRVPSGGWTARLQRAAKVYRAAPAAKPAPAPRAPVRAPWATKPAPADAPEVAATPVASPPPADAPVIAEEVAQPPADAPEVAEEVAQPPADAPVVAEEVAQPPADAPVVAEEVAQPPADAPVVAEEVAQPPADTPEVVEEVAQPPADTPEVAEEVAQPPADTPEIPATPEDPVLAAARRDLAAAAAALDARRREALEDVRSLRFKRSFEGRARRELLLEAHAELASAGPQGGPARSEDPEDGFAVRGAGQAARRADRRTRELTERIAALEAQGAWQALWAQEGAETRMQWLGRLGEREAKQPVLCRSFEREGCCRYLGCRYLHVPKKPEMPIVEARARELEQAAELSSRQHQRQLLRQRKKVSAEDASTAASDAGTVAPSEASLPSATTAEEHVEISEESAADPALSTIPEEELAQAHAKRRRALAKKLREIDVLIARGNLTKEEQSKVQRRADLERELAELA